MFRKQISAKEKFNEQIVTTIGDARTHYGNLKYQQFMNMVVMLDCLMESYKQDPEFIKKATVLLEEKQIDVLSRTSQEIMGMITENPAKKDRLYFIEWFKLLVSLSTRTIFAGRMTNVDIDLASVWDDYKRMTNMNTKKIEGELVDKSMTDTHEEPDGVSGSDSIEEIDIKDGVLE